MKIDTSGDGGDDQYEKITVKDRIGAQLFHHAPLDHFGIRVLLPLGHFLQTKIKRKPINFDVFKPRLMVEVECL
jgi:hypothetical protein